jgi:hypothetical protein
VFEVTERISSESPTARAAGLSPSQIRASIVFWVRQPIILAAHAIVLPILLVPLWGLREPTRLATWSVTALAYSGYIMRRGWIPWRMPMYQAIARRPNTRRSSEAELNAAAFINTFPRRAEAAAITATAALTPWIMFAVTAILDLRQIGRGTPTSLPVWGFAVLGFGDAVRASTFAIHRWARNVLDHWNEVA